MYIHISFRCDSSQTLITFIPQPDKTYRVWFTEQQPPLALLIECIIVCLIIVIKLNIQYAPPHTSGGVASSYDIGNIYLPTVPVPIRK